MTINFCYGSFRPPQKCDFNKVACIFIEITQQHGCTPVNLLHIFRTPFYKNTYGVLLRAFIKFSLLQMFLKGHLAIVLHDSCTNLVSTLVVTQPEIFLIELAKISTFSLTLRCSIVKHLMLCYLAINRSHAGS